MNCTPAALPTILLNLDIQVCHVERLIRSNRGCHDKKSDNLQELQYYKVKRKNRPPNQRVILKQHGRRGLSILFLIPVVVTCYQARH
jgi:hypothetical protein